MRLRFLVVDPNTQGDDCPAMQVNEETGDLAFVGETITDPDALTQLSASSGIKESETAILIPARMRKLILEALRELEDDPTIP
ncbi:hypothetical protein D5H75_32935 [Bailinhaonella thermotolerans]|uniref:Uncharacterized protein n=2 Tax=Bailinhaonella thermotolerans TaxID=1070861 RepID=A0A3A4A345_9ACTN|nr:hypothetical protein D5H75_32935 [Bailinhaonella thermotolerans]